MEEAQSNYEFDAPTHVVDFKAPEQEVDVDHWFEKQGENESSTRATPMRDERREVADVEEEQSASTVTNIVTSWGPTRSAQPKKKSLAAQPIRVSKRTKDQAAAPPTKRRRSTTTAQPPRQKAVVRQSMRVDPRAATKARAAAVNNTRARVASSEEQEMERIKILQNEVAVHRKMNEASYKAALAGSQPARKVGLSTTVPAEFNFSTDARIKSSASADASYKEVDFNAQLRRHPSSPAKASRGATVPKPFNLSTGTKRKAPEAPYVSTAQAIELFEKRTPDRYHLRSRRSQARGPSPVKARHPKMTEPHTPMLMTRQRSRPTAVKSSAELEAEELEKQQQFSFKASQLNRKILEVPLNPKKPAVKQPTQPEGFQLHLEKRVQERQASKKPEEPEEHYTFHSRPLPTRILEEVVGVPEKKLLHSTIPESPAFALKNRVRVERKVEEVTAPAPIKARPVPHFGLPFQPKRLDKNHAEVCPFSFDEKERARHAMKEKRLEALRNEEVPKFKAQPLPDFHEVVLPEKKVVEPTKPEPFRLAIDDRGAAKKELFERQLKEEQRRQMEAATFKARPNIVANKEPFLPKKENRSVLECNNSSVVPEGFQLATEQRAKVREERERERSEDEAHKAVLKEQWRKLEEQQEKENLAKLRQEQVHKAQPIRHYRPVEVKKSEVSLTVPQSPNFSDRFKL